MAALTGLLLGGLLAGGLFAGKKIGEAQQAQADQQAMSDQLGNPVTPPAPTSKGPAVATDASAPPDATKLASLAASAGQGAAARTRRRAAAGSSGNVQLPGGAQGVQAGTTPKTLLGY